MWGWLSHKLKLKYNDLEFELDGKNGYDYLMPETTIEVPENHKVFLGSKVNMFLQGINFEETQIESFSLAKNEVSNLEFQEFVDAGGYENPAYWDFPFEVGNKIYDFNSSIKHLQIWEACPANWSYGKFPAGQEDLPVTGISWFEARAYARF